MLVDESEEEAWLAMMTMKATRGHAIADPSAYSSAQLDVDDTSLWTSLIKRPVLQRL